MKQWPVGVSRGCVAYKNRAHMKGELKCSRQRRRPWLSTVWNASSSGTAITTLGTAQSEFRQGSVRRGRARQVGSTPPASRCWQQPFHECSLNTSTALPLLPAHRLIPCALTLFDPISSTKPASWQVCFPRLRQATAKHWTVDIRANNHCLQTSRESRVSRSCPRPGVICL